MPVLATQDLATMQDAVFFDGPHAARRVSRFWILIVLASIIAAAGVVADSTATVIGAMIVAPLMMPIQGTMLAVVIGDRTNLARSLGMVVAGAAAAIAIGFLVGLTVANDVVADTSSQVAGRVSPQLIDMLAALATGVVASVALARRDIADTLPGVAIAISLVPPLSVVGLTLEGGARDQAAGALLLFVTNVAAILATGTIVMGIYHVNRLVTNGGDDGRKPINRRHATLVIAAMLVIVGVPLTASSVKVARDASREGQVHAAGTAWADSIGWELVEVTTDHSRTVARFEGPLPVPATDGMADELRERGVSPGSVRVELLPRATVDLED